MNPDGSSRLHTATLLVLFFVSGFAALVYQVMWVRELGLLFGSTAQAAALTIAIFFAGLGAGSWFWGRRDEALEYYRAYERKLGSSLTDLLVPEGISLDLIELDHHQAPDAAG